MGWTATLIALAAALGLTLLFGWLGARPPNLDRGPRLVPWRLLMVLSAAVVLVLAVHVVNLAGVTTGR